MEQRSHRRPTPGQAQRRRRVALAGLALLLAGAATWSLWPRPPAPTPAHADAAPAPRPRPRRPPRPAPSADAPAAIEVRCRLESLDRGSFPPLDRLIAAAGDERWSQPVWPRPVPDAPRTWELSLWLEPPAPGADDVQQITLRDALIEPLRLRVAGGRCEAPPLRFKRGVACALGEDMQEALATLREGIDWVAQAEGGAHLPSRLGGATLTIWPEGPTGRGHLLLPGQPPAPLRWTGGACAPLHMSPTATVRGHLIDPLDQGGPYFVEGCGARALVHEDLRFTLQVAAAGPCQLEAWRMDGPLRALSEPAALEPEPGGELDLALALPPVRMAGLGIAFRVEEGGVRAIKVHEGSPAFDAGLREGDLIVEVDGQPTPGMSDNDFVAFGTGPSGSVARLVVAAEEGAGPEGTTTVEVRRGELSRLLR